MREISRPLDDPTHDPDQRRPLSLGVALILLGAVLNVAWILVMLWLGAYGIYALVR